MHAHARPARTHARTHTHTHAHAQTHTGARTRSSYPLHSVRRTVGAPFHHGLLEAVVAIPSSVASTEVHVLVTHLNPHSSEKRGRESEYVAGRVLELSARGVAVLVLGDLNTLSPLDDDAYVHSVYAFVHSTRAFTRTHARTLTRTHTHTHARTHTMLCRAWDKSSSATHDWHKNSFGRWHQGIQQGKRVRAGLRPLRLWRWITGQCRLSWMQVHARLITHARTHAHTHAHGHKRTKSTDTRHTRHTGYLYASHTWQASATSQHRQQARAQEPAYSAARMRGVWSRAHAPAVLCNKERKNKRNIESCRPRCQRTSETTRCTRLVCFFCYCARTVRAGGSLHPGCYITCITCVCVWRANGRRARNALHPKSGIMQCLFGLMLSIRPTCQKYILYCIALSVRPRARNACCMILYCTERTADVPEMRLDYILGNDKMAAASARAAFVQRDADTNRLSDHLPVLFDFKLI